MIIITKIHINNDNNYKGIEIHINNDNNYNIFANISHCHKNQFQTYFTYIAIVYLQNFITKLTATI
jgi:hypothetical protein